MKWKFSDIVNAIKRVLKRKSRTVYVNMNQKIPDSREILTDKRNPMSESEFLHEDDKENLSSGEIIHEETIEKAAEVTETEVGNCVDEPLKESFILKDNQISENTVKSEEEKITPEDVVNVQCKKVEMQSESESKVISENVENIDIPEQNEQFSDSKDDEKAACQDLVQLIIKPANPKYLKMLKPVEGANAYINLRNRIISEFSKIKLLCEIEINDKEYEMLCVYLKKRYLSIKREIEHSTIDILFSVALVQIGIRSYNGSFWKNVAKVLWDREDKDIPSNQRLWIGGTFTQTMLEFGKAIFKESEYVANIMMHCFVTDNFAPRFFEYLSQYYDYDLERDITSDAREESEYICNNIKNPYGKRKQFLSNYMYLSVICNYDYCCQMIASLLKLIDQSFWNEYRKDTLLEYRLINKFLQWDREKQNENKNDYKEITNIERIRKYKSPYLKCILENAKFQLVLPAQMLSSDIESLNIEWQINGLRNMILPCEIEEGYSGNKTREIIINLDAQETFPSFSFILTTGNKKIRKFSWTERKINFFDIDGNWLKGENLTEGLCYAFAPKNVKVESEAILNMRERREVNFFEFNLHFGDLICIDKDENYYIGEIQSSGLSKEYKIPSMFLKNNGKRVDVYSKLPALIINVEDDKFNGTAVMINGNISRFSEKSFTNIHLGKRIEEKYYYIDMRSLEGIHIGINQITIDFPSSSRKWKYEFGYLPGFKYAFEDAPYIYKNRGTLSLNRQILKKTILAERERIDQKYDFEFGELDAEYLILPMQIESMTIEAGFQVPVLMYSFDQENWFIKKPEDIWHSEIKSILYVKFNNNHIGLSIRGQNFNLIYDKNSNGVFECDLTKIKTYLNKNQMIQYVTLLDKNNEYNILRIIMRSFLKSAILEADYENECVKGIVDIIGKGDYYADVFCDNTLCVEKIAVKSGVVNLNIPIKSATYRIEVFETSGDAFGFDEDYDFIGKNEVKLIDSKELTGSCVKVNQLVMIEEEKLTFELKYQYLIFITQKINRHKYKGMLVEIFHNQTISHASIVVVNIPNLNDITKMSIMFTDYGEDNEYEFLYDSYAKCIVEDENPKYSKSEAYRRYEHVLHEDTYVWKVQFVDVQKDIEEKGYALIANRHTEKKQNSIWKEVGSEEDKR